METEYFCCHICGLETEIEIHNLGDLPEGWGWVTDEDPFQKSGYGVFYACPEHKTED